MTHTHDDDSRPLIDLTNAELKARYLVAAFEDEDVYNEIMRRPDETCTLETTDYDWLTGHDQRDNKALAAEESEAEARLREAVVDQMIADLRQSHHDWMRADAVIWHLHDLLGAEAIEGMRAYAAEIYAEGGLDGLWAWLESRRLPAPRVLPE